MIINHNLLPPCLFCSNHGHVHAPASVLAIDRRRWGFRTNQTSRLPADFRDGHCIKKCGPSCHCQGPDTPNFDSCELRFCGDEPGTTTFSVTLRHVGVCFSAVERTQASSFPDFAHENQPSRCSPLVLSSSVLLPATLVLLEKTIWRRYLTIRKVSDWFYARKETTLIAPQSQSTTQQRAVG